MYRAPERTSEVSVRPSWPTSAAIRSSRCSRSLGRSCCAIARRGRSRSAKFITDPIWWFYLFWLPKFLDARYGIKLAQLAAPLIVIYLLADVGSVFGGWLSGAFIKRGWSVNAARKMTMLIAALLIVPTMFAPAATNMWVAVASSASPPRRTSGGRRTSSRCRATCSRGSRVGSVVGIGGFFGAAGGVLFQRATGWLLQRNGSNYTPIFIVCGLAYVTALLVIHLLVPRVERVSLGAPSVR